MNNGESLDPKGANPTGQESVPVKDLPLEDVFQEFLMLADTPDASTLETMVAKYPQYAADLTDFAVEWAMQDMLPGDAMEFAEVEAEDVVGEGMSQAVAKAMDRLHEGLAGSEPEAVPDPFHGRVAADLKALAKSLGLDKTLVAKLRDRRIEAVGIPKRLVSGLAEQLEVSFDAMMGHLQGPPVLSMGASFKAKGKPEATGKESFAQAVERSQLSDDDKQRLTDLDSDDE